MNTTNKQSNEAKLARRKERRLQSPLNQLRRMQRLAYEAAEKAGPKEIPSIIKAWLDLQSNKLAVRYPRTLGAKVPHLMPGAVALTEYSEGSPMPSTIKADATEPQAYVEAIGEPEATQEPDISQPADDGQATEPDIE
jgi:hypothetical protein